MRSVKMRSDEVHIAHFPKFKRSHDHEHAHIRDSTVDQRIKFVVSSFSYSRDIPRGLKIQIGSRDHNHAPFVGDVSFY